MQASRGLWVGLSLMITMQLEARVIYGEDHRVEVFEANDISQMAAKSAASMILQTHIQSRSDNSGMMILSQRTFGEWMESVTGGGAKLKNAGPSLEKAIKTANAPLGFCPGERFVEQPNPSMCSGFLIAPDLLVTAGHCAEVENFCQDYKWVFDFKVDSLSRLAGREIKQEDIYSCDKVISSALSTSLSLDYAIVKLDRKVTGRAPLIIAKNKDIELGTGLFVVGSPSGLPLKVAGGAEVLKNDHPFYFTANLDTFQGNSGSGVFNAATGTVEGIIVRGEEDFSFNKEKYCIEAKRCTDKGCRGEDVSRLSSMPEVALQDVLYKSSIEGNIQELQKILQLEFWIDFYTNDGQSAFIKAMGAAQAESSRLLLQKGARVNLQDQFGESALHVLMKRSPQNKVNLKKIREMVTLFKTYGGDLELRNDAGDTALLVASKIGHLNWVKLLISIGADINAQDRNQETILFRFAREKNKRAVKELIKLGVNKELKNIEGVKATDIIKL